VRYSITLNNNVLLVRYSITYLITMFYSCNSAILSIAFQYARKTLGLILQLFCFLYFHHFFTILNLCFVFIFSSFLYYITVAFCCHIFNISLLFYSSGLLSYFHHFFTISQLCFVVIFSTFLYCSLKTLLSFLNKVCYICESTWLLFISTLCPCI
jgi:hypothetical protein